MQVFALERDEVLRGSDQSVAAAYSSDFARLRDCYVDGWQSLAGVKARAASLLDQGAFEEIDRAGLVRTLSSAMRPLGASPASMDMVKRLAEPGAFAIVTGQQACIGGGPLFVLAKVAHAIALAKELRAEGVNAVPIFWAASEDHDLDEANRFTILDQKGKVKTLSFRDLGNTQAKALEALRLPDADHPEAEAIMQALGDGPHLEEAKKLLRLGLGASFGAAINRLLLSLFADEGLVVVEPRHLRKFSGFRRVLGMEIERPNLLRDEIEASNQLLRSRGFQPALELREYLNIFALCSGRRRHLYFDGRSIDIIDEGRAYSSRGEALMNLAEHPERFSSGVALRPIVQGACLPTLAYVGGPGEIAYHASLAGVFQRAGVPMPLLVPRWSIVLNEHADRVGAVRKHVLESGEAAKRAAASISEGELEIRGLLRQSAQSLGKLATMLEQDFERIEGRAAKALKELRGRTVALPLQRTGITDATRQTAAEIEPNRQPQERALSWLGLWPKWGGILRERLSTREAFNFSLEALGPSS